MIFKKWRENKKLQAEHYERSERILLNIYKKLCQIKDNTTKTERRTLK